MHLPGRRHYSAASTDKPLAGYPLNQPSSRILLAPESRIVCPHCEREFALADGFARQALEQVEQVTSGVLARLREEERLAAERRAAALATERDAAHARALAEVRALTTQSFAPQLDQLRAQLLASEARAAELVAAERLSFEQRLAAQTARLAELQGEQLALREERQRLHDEKAALALDVQRRVDAQLQQREAVVRAQEQERALLDKAELQKKLDDAAEQLATAQRRMEQGSQQLQGEVLELAIEEALRRAFPLDAIEEVKKGQRGGDVLQHVRTRTGQVAGIILWETKRAREWSAQWVAKLKDDMRASGAAVGILVTMPGALPRDWPAGAYFALYDEVWVTQPTTCVGVAEALRASLVDLHRQRAVSAGKGEKMEALYDYLTSPQFAQKLRAVFDTFRKMKEELESEKNVTTQRWARREKALQAGMTQLLGIGGEIQGLAQQELAMLELEDGGGDP